MNRINPELFSAAFTGWVREMWPDRPDLVAIDGKTSRRSHDRSAGAPPLHLVSAFATTARLVLGQEAVADKSNETTAIPVLLARLGEKGGLKGAVVSLDAIATNATIASAIKAQGADYLLAVKANQPTLRAEVEAYFAHAPAGLLDTDSNFDKGHGRIEHRTVTVARDVDWLNGHRRFPGELRLPSVACIIRVQSRTELRDRCRYDTRYFISSANLAAKRAGEVVRSHWAIENSLHWTLDVVFNEDQSRLRKGHGAKNMAVVRHFAFNLARQVAENAIAPSIDGRTGKPRAPRRHSLKLRRRIADWDRNYLATILTAAH